jgi:FKBP-type peptidyl-prolyl cis-trans isomerase FklB
VILKSVSFILAILESATLKFAIRCATTLSVVLLAGTAFAQDAPSVNKDQPAPAASGAKREAKSETKTEVKQEAKNEAANTPAKSQTEEPGIQNRKDKISYAFGVDLGRDLKQQKNDLNVDLLLQALRDTLADKPLLMTGDEVTATLKKLEAEEKQDHEHAKTMISEKNKIAGEAFFSENAKKEGVVTLPSGLQYKIVKKGDGKLPGPDDKIVCQYRAALVDGTEFDSTEKRGHAMTLPVKGIMPGWTQALQMMPVGSKWQLVIPPQLAYGDKIVNGIGPNATLIFEVELVSIEDKPQTVSAAR